jgi:hypothetical protein
VGRSAEVKASSQARRRSQMSSTLAEVFTTCSGAATSSTDVTLARKSWEAGSSVHTRTMNSPVRSRAAPIVAMLDTRRHRPVTISTPLVPVRPVTPAPVIAVRLAPR